MYKLILICFLAVALIDARAQNILQDNKGQTALSLNPVKEKDSKEAGKETIPFGIGQIKLSTVEKKLELNYYQYFRPDKKAPSFLGVSASGEIKNSLTSVLSSGDVAPGTSIKLKYGKRLYKSPIADYDAWEKKFITDNNRNPDDSEISKFVAGLAPAKDLWFVINTGFDGSKFKLFYPDSAYGAQLKKINFTAVEINGGFNFWNSNFIRSTILFGATIGYKNSNNFDDLTESTSEEVTVRTNAADSSTRKVTEKNTVYKGKYKETKSYPLNIDLYFKPHKFENVAFLLYGRHVMYQGEKPQTKFGAGVYFLRNNNLFDPVFGINIDYADVFNNNHKDDDKSNFTKLSIGIVTDLKTLLFQKK